jgi:cell division protein FtsL
MSDVDFEYAIRQDVKNNPIVRELDRDRVRELWRWVIVLGVLVGVLVFSAWQHFQVLRYGYLIERTRQEMVAEQELRRHLMLERAALLAPQRIERLATRQLRLVAPDPAATIVIERVNAPAPPDRGVVASR